MELRNEQTLGEKFFQNGDAIFALATLPGKSAIAIFRCSGKDVWHLFQQAFSRYNALLRAVSHTITYGFLLQPETGEKLDEVLLLKFCEPHSYSGEDMLEIHCHGSIAVLDALYQLLISLGLREAGRGEFTYRSIKYGKQSLHKAEAIALLSQSRSQNQRRSALEQFSSSMQKNLQKIRNDLLQILARSELQLDYDETELEFHYKLPDSLPLAEQSLQYLQNCLTSYQLQQSHWREYKIVLVGATNSGKSSLFNCLLTKERSIVSQQAGTTRDYVEARFEFAGHNILLYDTAGLRYNSNDAIEQQGIQRTWQLIEQADFLFLLSDVRIAQQHETNDKAIQELQKHRRKLQETGQPFIEIWNKCDLLDEPPVVQKIPHPVFLCSAVNEQGIAPLLAELATRLPNYLGQQSEGPVNERQAKLLDQAAQLLQEYCSRLQRPELFELDWASELLRQICGRLGEVNGDSCNAVMLRDIFQQFCIGK